MTVFNKAFLSICLALGSVAAPALAQTTLAERDIAIALPMESSYLVPASLSLGQSGVRLFPKQWFDQVNSAFKGSSAGDVLESESPFEDWQVVSARITPCNPLGQNPKQNITELCWPELRLVWQPILRKVTLHSLFMEAAGEDRAIHAIYPVEPTLVLNAEETLRVNNALVAINAGTKTNAKFSSLPSAQMNDFVTLRNRVTAALLKDTVALRQMAPSEYVGIGLRPEMLDGKVTSLSFRTAFQGLLQKYALPGALRVLTAFSLPEGREPAHLDEWIFLSFKGEAGLITPAPISVVSHTSNEVLHTTTHVNRGSMRRDDDSFYESADLDILGESVLLFEMQREQLLPVLADRNQRLVPNTSCISCHKLNPIRFDLHNFSYLEDRPLTVSPRVVEDVRLDLQWIKSHDLSGR